MENVTLLSLSAAIRSLDEALKNHMLILQEGLPSDEKPFPPIPAPGVRGRRNSVMPGGTTAATAAPGAGAAAAVPPVRKAETTANGTHKKPEKMKVSIRVVFLKIGVIDTIHDRYTAEVLVQSKWNEPALDGKNQASDAIDYEQHWNPRLSIENAIGEPKNVVTYGVSYDRSGRCTLCESRRVYGQFFEFMELNQFPFDEQDLTVSVSSEWEEGEIELEEDHVERCGINAQAFSAEQEWALEKALNIWKKTSTKIVNNVTMKFPGLCVAAKAARRPQFFIWNIIVIMCAICSLAFVTFTVNLETPQFRLQLTFILLLTTVTFKFVVNKSLPRISYLTYLDKYILGSMVILCFICVWHAIIGSIIYSSLPKTTTVTVSTPPPTTMSSLLAPNNTTTGAPCPGTKTTTLSPGPACILADRIALGILSSTYVIFHVVFLILILCVSKADDDKSGDDDGKAEINNEH